MKIKKISAIVMAVIVLALISIYVVPSVYSNVTSDTKIYKALIDSTDAKTYVCPMHPEVTSDKPGDCPKCGMALVLKTDDNKEMSMNCCKDMEKCKLVGCDTDKCKGETGGCKGECMEKCKDMKEHKDMNMNDKDCRKECPMMKDKKDMKMDGGDCKSKCEHK